jgi:formylglycine-generating enzyme required for sulfatase activity
MECSPGDGECDADEPPVLKVTITEGFWMGQTEVTQAAYRKMIKFNPSQFKGEKRPVEGVS